MKSKGNTIGNVLRKYRNYQNLSRAKLAEKSGISEDAIESYEYGRVEPPFTKLKQLHKILDIPFMEFFPDILHTKGYIAKADEKLIKSGIAEIVEQNPELVEINKFYAKHSKEISLSRLLNLLRALSKIPASKRKQKLALIMKYIKE